MFAVAKASAMSSLKAINRGGVGVCQKPLLAKDKSGGGGPAVALCEMERQPLEDAPCVTHFDPWHFLVNFSLKRQNKYPFFPRDF
jgi:hypothetical protein